MMTTTGRIRALNDRLRVTGQGGDILVSRGLATLGSELVAAVFAAVQHFASFTTANDPYGEHDFASLEVAGHKVIFKIDYYDATLSGPSPDPADPCVTRRVLTVMLAEDY